SYQTRLSGGAMWEILTFVVNALVFALVGLQLPRILDALSGRSASELLLYAVGISLTVIATRILWVFPFTYLPRVFWRRVRERDPYPNWRAPAAISWMGMRGAISLAAALALPLKAGSGDPFPQRALIIYLTFA